MSVLVTAKIFAMMAHKAQKRKYTDQPYYVHLEKVASFAPELAKKHPEVSAEIIGAVGWLHDCVEDQAVTFQTLHDLFIPYGPEVQKQILTGVYFLSDMEEGSRAIRKQLSNIRLSNAPGWVQSLKCVDTMDNAPSIYANDKAFSIVFKEEKKVLLPLLTKADKGIRTRALSVLNRPF